MIRRFLVSTLFSFVSLAIFIALSIFALAAASSMTNDPNMIIIIKPLIFLGAVLIGSLPWVFLAYLTADENWKEALQCVYFLPLLLFTVSFAPAAVAFAVIFVLARIFYRRRDGVQPKDDAEEGVSKGSNEELANPTMKSLKPVVNSGRVN